MGKNSTASALKEPISAATPSSGRKPSNASGLINTGGSRQNALSTKAASSQVNDNMATSVITAMRMLKRLDGSPEVWYATHDYRLRPVDIGGKWHFP